MFSFPLPQDTAAALSTKVWYRPGPVCPSLSPASSPRHPSTRHVPWLAFLQLCFLHHRLPTHSPRGLASLPQVPLPLIPTLAFFSPGKDLRVYKQMMGQDLRSFAWPSWWVAAVTEPRAKRVSFCLPSPASPTYAALPLWIPSEAGGRPGITRVEAEELGEG